MAWEESARDKSGGEETVAQKSRGRSMSINLDVLKLLALLPTS